MNKIRFLFLSEVRNENVNGEEVFFMDVKLNILFLKLNDIVDRICKIRNRFFLNVKELLGYLYEWIDVIIVSIIFLS